MNMYLALIILPGLLLWAFPASSQHQLLQHTFSTGSDPGNAPASANYTLEGSALGTISGEASVSAGYRLLPGYFLGPLAQESSGGSLSVKVFLEGPFDAGSGLMSTTLNASGFLPLSQPYHQAPWSYAGAETVEAIPAHVVDWVLVELRDAPSPAQATAATTLEGWPRALFLGNDGMILSLDGNSLPVLDALVVQHQLFVVVRHRNHLAVMSAEGLSFDGQAWSWDFTQAGKAYSPGDKSAFLDGQKPLGGGVYAMFGGDGDANGQVQNQDKNNIWNPESGLGGYLQGDFDMNGQVQNQDKNNIWNPNSGIGTAVP